MWLAKQTKQQRSESAAQRGTVSPGGLEAGVVSCGEEREVYVISPGGYVWRPRSGEGVLLLKGGTDGRERYVLGTADGGEPSLQEGELCLYSAGGAKILLRADGRIELLGAVYINGEPYVSSAEGTE